MAFDSSDPLALEGPWPLVGRRAVVERALAALRGAAGPVVLRGASGVGRSRIAAEVASALEEEGWLSVTVVGNPALPQVPLATIAPALTRETSRAIAEAEDGDALLAAATATVGRLGQGRCILLVVEDAAAADPVSLRLIAGLVEEGLLRLLLTVEHDQLPAELRDVAATPDALLIEVRELDRDETDELLTRVLGAPVEARALSELHRASSGNPMLLREIVIHAGGTGALIQDRDRWRLREKAIGSPVLRQLVRARLQALTHEERDVVERLALCQPLALDEFGRPGAPEAIADLEQRGVVRVEESRDRLHMLLAHPEYAAAARERIPRVRHATLLAQQADLVERRGASPADELRVALWRLDARRPSDPALLMRCARLAMGAGDHRRAERLVSAAITSGADGTDDHLLHSRLLAALSRRTEALSALDRAQERAVNRADRAAIAAQRTEILAGG